MAPSTPSADAGHLAANKACVEQFFAAFSRADWTTLAGLLADDFRWVLVAHPTLQSASLAGVESPAHRYTKDETFAIYRHTVAAVVDGRFTVEVLSMTAEADRVAAEARGQAVSSLTGRTYANLYHHLFVLRDGKVVEVREYQDTLHAYDVWTAP